VTSIITQLMTLEQRPLTLLAAKQATADAKISAYGMVKSALSTFQTAAQALGKEELFAARKATIADASVATVAASTTATPGNLHDRGEQPGQIAGHGFDRIHRRQHGDRGQRYADHRTGQLQRREFHGEPRQDTVTVTVGSGAATLADVRDAINNADAGVTASLINDGSPARASC
jgi:flagellar hook-associated protein 2